MSRQANHPYQQHQPYADEQYPGRNYQIPPASVYASPLPRQRSISPPLPPQHGSSPLKQTGHTTAWQPSDRKPIGRPSDATLHSDNIGSTAAGGSIAGIALGVANNSERGLKALGSINDWSRTDSGQLNGRLPSSSNHTQSEYSYTSVPHEYSHNRPAQPLEQQPSQISYSSTRPFAVGAAGAGTSTPVSQASTLTLPLDGRPFPSRYVSDDGHHYADNPYNQFSTGWDPRVRGAGLGTFDPTEITDDGDDGFKAPRPQRRPILSLGRPVSENNNVNSLAGAASAPPGGFINTLASRDASGNYGPVGGGAANHDGGTGMEKSEWLRRQNKGNKKLKWVVGAIVTVLVLAAIAGGAVGGILGSRKSRTSSPSQGQSAAEDDGKGDLSKDSAEIQKLLNNNNLHKVFPGMAYAPFNAQYPGCLTYPPSQNNITRDMAVLSQVTNAVRLYGTDCNQTEMVLHSIDRLALKDMKVWLGVWLGNNGTTNQRQLNQMYDILDKHGAAPFAGIIIGNEVLYRKDLTATQLGTVLTGVRSNLTSKSIELPIATSDLGDNWTQDLTTEVDIVMANIHPFFAGATADVAADWTWNFWQEHDVILTQGTNKKNIISEVGWPSQGGNHCGAGTCTDSTSGSVAGIDEMNTFMDKFVCQSLDNGTDYFWFEAFDEPWKIQFNTKTQNWEDHWGLWDINRNLKPGVKIPDCGGKTVS